MLLGERVREARASAGLSVSDLARAIGIRPQAITQIENGKTKSLKASTATGISRVTGYSVTWLTTGRGKKLAREDRRQQAEIMTATFGDDDFLRVLAESIPSLPRSDVAMIARLCLERLADE